MYKRPPLPFEGNKKLWRKKFISLIDSLDDDYIYCDLFGGSGILSHWIKKTKPESTVIYNDYDYYIDRLNKIEQTNNILDELRELLKDIKHGSKLSKETKGKVIEILKQYDNPDLITLRGSLHFSRKVNSKCDNVETFSNYDFYNNISKTNKPNVNDYLEDLIIEHKDWEQLYKEVKDKYKDKKIVFIMDPPYIYADRTDYKNKYWKLNDSIKIMKILKDELFIMFNSTLSTFKETLDNLNELFNLNINYNILYNKMIKIYKSNRVDYCLISNKLKYKNNN